MYGDLHDRALAVFDAFLRYAREASPAPAAVPSTNANANANANAVPAVNAPGRESLLDDGPAPAHEDYTTPNLQVARPPSQPPPTPRAAPSAPPPGAPLLGAADPPSPRDAAAAPGRLRSAPGTPANASASAPVSPPVPPEGALGVPGIPRFAPQVDSFLAEMAVLVKYGHAQQVSREIERWIRAAPDDLAAHVRLGEFELSRIDAKGGYERLLALTTRALDRGEISVAWRGYERLAREAPHDPRVGALGERVGSAPPIG